MTPDKPRLLFFAHETTWSGAPIQLLHLVTWLKSNGWDLAMAVPRPETREAGPITDVVLGLGVEVYSCLDLSKLPDLAFLADLSRQFDVVIANTLAMWAAVRSASEAGVASIWYIHESLVAQHLIEQIPEIRPTLALADRLVVPTMRTAQTYSSSTDRSFRVIPYGIPPAVVHTLTTRPSQKITFLLLGSYEPRKGQDIFLRAIKELSQCTRERALFQMAGRNLDPQFYKTLLSDTVGFPEVQLLGELAHEEACSAIAAADVVVCASRDETMPIALLEAMSLAKAVISTNVGGIVEWLENGANALIIPANDPAALARAIVQCLDQPHLRETLGRNGRETFARHFAIDRLGESFAELFGSLSQGKLR